MLIIVKMLSVGLSTMHNNITVDMGYAYGHLLAEEIKECYYALLYSLVGNDLEDKELIEVLGLALDWQWRDYLVSTYCQ